MLDLPTSNLGMVDGFSLRIRSLGLHDLGPYTCQAYNGQGPAASSTTIVQALGPIAPSVNPEDEQYRRFIVDAPRPPPPRYPQPPPQPRPQPDGGRQPGGYGRPGQDGGRGQPPRPYRPPLTDRAGDIFTVAEVVPEVLHYILISR